MKHTILLLLLVFFVGCSSGFQQQSPSEPELTAQSQAAWESSDSHTEASESVVEPSALPEKSDPSDELEERPDELTEQDLQRITELRQSIPYEGVKGFVNRTVFLHTHVYTWYEDKESTEINYPQLSFLGDVSSVYEEMLQEHMDATARQLFGDDDMFIL